MPKHAPNRIVPVQSRGENARLGFRTSTGRGQRHLNADIASQIHRHRGTLTIIEAFRKAERSAVAQSTTEL